MSNSDSSNSDKPPVKKTSSPSLLSILHEKNQTIMTLQLQLNNQKAQLDHYLSNCLPRDKLEKYSKTCVLSETEENLALNMEMARFCKRTGLKSGIVCMYEDMKSVEEKLRSLMNLQEHVLQVVLGKVMRLELEEEKEWKEALLGKNPEQHNILYSLLRVNAQLRNEIDTFRVCCDRLMTIEDERNALAEELCSLPPNEKFRRRALMITCDERLKLEREVQLLREDKSLAENKCRYVESCECMSLEELNGMLNAVNLEAALLLRSSIEQKQIYNLEKNKLKKSNKELKEKAEHLELELKSKQEMNKKYDKMQQLCLKVVQENLSACYHQQKKLKYKTGKLKSKLDEVSKERDILRERLIYLNLKGKDDNEFDEKILEEIQKIAVERDMYKIKVDETENLKEECEKLAEENGLLRDLKEANENKICDLKDSCENLRGMLKEKEEKITTMSRQIKNLLLILNVVQTYYKVNSDEVRSDGDTTNEKVQKRESLLEKIVKSCDFCGLKNGEFTSIAYMSKTLSTCGPAFYSTSNMKMYSSIQLGEKHGSLKKIFPLNRTHKNVRSAVSMEHMKRLVAKNTLKIASCTKEVKSVPEHIEAKSEGAIFAKSENDLKTLAKDKDGHSDTTSSLDSEDFDALKVPTLAESELMKDCSCETLVGMYKRMNMRTESTNTNLTKNCESALRKDRWTDTDNVGVKTQTSDYGVEKACGVSKADIQTSTGETREDENYVRENKNDIEEDKNVICENIQIIEDNSGFTKDKNANVKIYVSNEEKNSTGEDNNTLHAVENATKSENTNVTTKENKTNTENMCKNATRDNTTNPMTEKKNIFDLSKNKATSSVNSSIVHSDVGNNTERSKDLANPTEFSNSENDEFARHLMEISETDLMEKIESMSSQILGTINERGSNRSTVLGALRRVFDTFFGSESVYAKP